MTESKLELENRRYAGTGGVSRENRGLGFRPAFMNPATRTVFLARFADGRPAPFHLLDGLPAEVRACAVSGFEREGRFYTRDEAAAVVAAEPLAEID